MFICVKYGDKLEYLFNANCPAQTLIRQVKLRCGCGNDEEIDVADLDGNVKNIRDLNEKYASDVLTERENLILLKIEKQTGVGKKIFKPMLNDENLINDTFLEQLNNLHRKRVTGRPKQRQKEEKKKSLKAEGRRGSISSKGLSERRRSSAISVHE